MRCEVKEGDAVLVAMRCSDCTTWLEVSLTRKEMEELDRAQAVWREEILAAYEHSVSESMEALAAILGPALEQDLVGADDFALRVSARPRPPAGS
jgi:hypothetical protein